MKKKVERIRSVHCSDIIESKNKIDFKSFKCGAVSIDGDLDYLKRISGSSPAEEHN
ncbi:DUF7695 domain-containing protein [Lysinibacillus xylanilyticus]|uniref:DUF7695 domain-containing protein n=1 Tax=Lysinibacillus xylanilyticus TaxID=582475 RepID=UPI003D06A9C9